MGTIHGGEGCQLSTPVEVRSEVNRALFNPTLVKIKWDDEVFHHEFWFPYWIAINDAREKYGQFAPMTGENSLLELLKEATRQDFFTDDFLNMPSQAITNKLTPRPA